MAFIKEFWKFSKLRKKYWLLPVVIILLIIGCQIVLTQSLYRFFK